MHGTTIGIIGGMGAEATAQFYMNFIKKTQVSIDQDHYHVIIDSNAKIPDRTKYILGKGKSPVPALIETAKNLEKLGVQVGCIPCITAHNFIDDIQAQVNFKIIHAIKEVNEYLKEVHKSVKRVGVLCTSGTRSMGIYNKFLEEVEVMYPTETAQEEWVMKAIYGKGGIKEGHYDSHPIMLLKKAGNQLIENGAEIIIAGCTEIPLALKASHLNVPYIDTMDVVIEKLLTYK